MTDTSSPLAIVIIGAGKGTRMCSALAKVLHPLAGRPLIGHVLTLAAQFVPDRLVIVVGHQSDAVRNVCEAEGATCVVQEPQLGTGHAVAQAEPLLSDFEGDVIVLYGDVPLLQESTIQQLWAEHRHSQAAVTVLTASVLNPQGYGRIVRDAEGHIQRIVEERDASDDELAISEVNSGIYCLRSSFLFAALKRVGSENAQGEQYLTDVIGLAVSDQQRVSYVMAANPIEITGVNTRVELARLETVKRQQLCETHMLAGVTLLDPLTTVLDIGVCIGQDTVIAPQTHILGVSSIGAGCQIGPQVVIEDSTIGDGVKVEPFCHLRNQAICANTLVPTFSNLTST